MRYRHTLFFLFLPEAEKALHHVRRHLNDHAGIYTPIGTTYAHAVIFESAAPLSAEGMEVLQGFRAAAVSLNQEL